MKRSERRAWLRLLDQAILSTKSGDLTWRMKEYSGGKAFWDLLPNGSRLDLTHYAGWSLELLDRPDTLTGVRLVDKFYSWPIGPASWKARCLFAVVVSTRPPTPPLSDVNVWANTFDGATDWMDLPTPSEVDES